MHSVERAKGSSGDRNRRGKSYEHEVVVAYRQAQPRGETAEGYRPKVLHLRRRRTWPRGQEPAGHRRGRHRRKNSRYRAKRESIISLRTNTHAEAYDIRGEKARRGLGLMMRFQSATLALSWEAGRLRSPSTWVGDGPGLTLRKPLVFPSRSSTTPPCRHWEATGAAGCCFSAWERALAPP